MIAVIIAGGSGTRLWPLSTPDYPKHLLKLTNDKSLLQNTLARTQKLVPAKKIFIIPEISHNEHVVRQLAKFPQNNLLVEPARRGTASCVLLAMREIKKRQLDKNEPIAILWADHLIRDERGFIATFKRAAKLTKKYRLPIFIGAEPAYPSTGFGYMEHGKEIEGETEAYKLVRFHEKPDHLAAEKYFASGNFFWNMGYLVISLSTFEHVIKEASPEYWKAYQTVLGAKDIAKTYIGLESAALDYVFSEKCKDALVIPGSFDWADIGSFGDLHGISVQDELGNYVKGKKVTLEGVTNSYIHNDSGIPVAIIGLDNVVVVHTKHGILVTNKNFAQKVGEISKKL